MVRKRTFSSAVVAESLVSGAPRLAMAAVGGIDAVAVQSVPAALPQREAVEPGIPLVECLPGRVFLVYRRALDVVASAVGLSILGVLLPALAVLIKLDSPGPVFYRQTRVGINRRRRLDSAYRRANRRKVLQPGQPFQIVKLRTMGTNAEVNGPQWAQANDVRVTRVGKFLRKTRLDELPQFWNVLRGEMSLIGPRPERLVFVRQFEGEISSYSERLLMKPGLTGLAQVRNGYDTDLESVRRKVRYDRESIRRASLALDLNILMSTVRVVLKGEGAH